MDAAEHADLNESSSENASIGQCSVWRGHCLGSFCYYVVCWGCWGAFQFLMLFVLESEWKVRLSSVESHPHFLQQAMGGDEEEQWTYVAGKGGKHNRKNDRRSAGRRRGRDHRNNAMPESSSSRATAASSFYASSKEKDGQDDSKALASMTEEQVRHIQNEVQLSIMRIMEELERHPYVTHLLQALMASGGVEEDDKDDDTSKENKEYGEIVCYGIGNFLPPLSDSNGGAYSLPRYPSAPMLQLALALVIRKHLAIHCSRNELKVQNDSDDSGNSSNIHSENQDLVKMLFFEPIMTELERTILNDALCVDIIETNERGKRQAQSNGKRTLFYMPHCPMRLYSNVLWANWGEPLWSGNVVVYGNNFHGYDDRILSNEERTDPTNAVLKIIPHLVANQINGLTSNASGGVESDLLVKMENAFNDCVVMTFDSAKDDESEEGEEGRDCCFFPDRPKEHVFDEEGDGEVI